MAQGLGFAGAVSAGMMAWFAYQSTPPNLVRAQSNAATTQATPAPKQKILRRHSSGDHAFLPNRQERHAIKSANKNVRVSARPCPSAN